MLTAFENMKLSQDNLWRYDYVYSKTNGENVHVLKNENEHTNKLVDIQKLGKLSEAVYCQIHDGCSEVVFIHFKRRG